MSFEEWIESEATKEFRGLLAFDRKAKELAKAAWLASREAVKHRVQADTSPADEDDGSVWNQCEEDPGYFS